MATSTRDRLLDSALQRFADEGVLATTLDQVREGAGASVGAVYHHFPGGRDQLLREAAGRLGVSETALREDLRRTRVQPRTQADGAQEPGAKAAEPPVEEKDLVRLLLHHPDTADFVKRYVRPEQLSDARCRVLVEGLLIAADVETDITALAREAGDDCLQLLSALMAADTKYTGADEPHIRAAQDLVVAVRRRQLERRIRDLLASRDRAGEAGREQLTQEIAQLKYDMAHLRQGWEKAQPILDLDA